MEQSNSKRNKSTGYSYRYVNRFGEKFDSLHENNKDLSVETKISTLKVSLCVVGVASVSVDMQFHFFGSGTIISCDRVSNTRYVSTVLTSGSMFGDPRDGVQYEAQVYLHDGRRKNVRAYDYDGHYNIALLKIETIQPLSTAILKDVKVINKSAARGGTLCRHSEAFYLCHGDEVISVGRFFKQPYEVMSAPGTFSDKCCNLDCPLMLKTTCNISKCGNEPFMLKAAPGAFSHGCCSLDCPPLLKTTCNVSKCGTGGPLINLDGEVIGVNFFAEGYTPFLPMNIIFKCLEHFEKNGNFVRPFVGIKGVNLCAATSMSTLEKIISKFPDISKGILVKEVVPQSPAYHAGICAGDILTSSDGDIIKNVVEFEATLFDRIGESVELQVLRKQTKFEERTVVIGETSPDNFFSWTLPKERWVTLNS